MPRLPRETKLREAGKLKQFIPFAELAIGTAIRPSRERLRTVADGCERLRTVAQRLADTAQPHTLRVKQEPLLRIREKGPLCSRSLYLIHFLVNRRHLALVFYLSMVLVIPLLFIGFDLKWLQEFWNSSFTCSSGSWPSPLLLRTTLLHPHTFLVKPEQYLKAKSRKPSSSNAFQIL